MDFQSMLSIGLPLGVGLAAIGSGVGLGRAVGSAMDPYLDDHRCRAYRSVDDLCTGCVLSALRQDRRIITARVEKLLFRKQLQEKL